jgi:uncharacterized protein YndB with AHSA1/START domain
MNGTLETVDGRPALRFERNLTHRIERVWRAIIVPTELERWFPAAADWTPEAGEVFEVGGQTGQVTELEPPHLIEWTFGGQRFRFELRAQGQGCSLTFTHVFDDRAIAAQTAAGWDRCFARLDALFAEHTMSEADSLTAWPDVHERLAKTWNIDLEIGRNAYAQHSRDRPYRV